MHADARAFARRIHSRYNLTPVGCGNVDFAIDGDWNAAHRVMRGRFDRHEARGGIEPGIIPDRFDHLWQHLMHSGGVDAGHIEPYTVLGPFRILRVGDAPPGHNLAANGP